MVKSLCEIDAAVWDHYVSSQPAATPYHLYGWREVIESTYGHRPYYLTLPAKSSATPSAIRGILPLVHFRTPTTESRLISLPYFDCAGLLADDPEAERSLMAKALELATELDAAHLEIRQDHPAAMPTETECAAIGQGISYQAHGFKVGLRRTLPDSAEALWRLLPSKLRNQVQKARRSGCIGKVGGQELLDDFYAVFSLNMRDLGSPVHAKGLFEQVFRHFPDHARIILVEHEAMPVAVALVFRFGQTLYNPWASSLRAYRPLCPNMLLYWQMLAHACGEGLRFFDFGRSSPNASTCTFKLQWGATMRPLIWHIFSRQAKPWLPQRETLAVESWKGLDLALSRQLGPELRRLISL